MSVTTDANGALLHKQEFDPWGNVRAGDVPETTLDYTGQRRDTTGLLYYNARYYDPVSGHFLSADTVVPGNASGGMDGVALKPLTVSFAEPGLLSSLNSEESHADKLYWGGPANPQSLNRYSYVQNNPIIYRDPTGHEPRGPKGDPVGKGWSYRIDAFNNGDGFEIHVFNPRGQEVGIVAGRDGWINKHNKPGEIPSGMPEEVINNINGVNVSQLRRRGLIPEKGVAPSIKNGSYLLEGRTIMGVTGLVLSLIPGVIDDIDRFNRASKNGISFDAQLEKDVRDMGNPQYIDTPLGPFPNPWYNTGVA
ncbi:RHS repeat-associated core domain-containing protein [Chloroflexia bacterium SDU3-3]|nr:RHS repeat-associated core domain-containing protein [Chloroflexia bacterium SDU3-3]